MASNIKEKDHSSAESTTAMTTSHVHFDQTVIKDDFESDNSIIYHKSTTGNNIVIHLGFLQVKHRYKVELKIPANVFNITNATTNETTTQCNTPDDENQNNELNGLVLVIDDEDMPNLNCRMLQYHGKCVLNSTTYYAMDVEFFAHKEKLLKEELKLAAANDPNDKFKLMFQARVLGRGKGTPMLRNGIHCIGIDADDESDASDWHGFSRNDSD